ncbi:MAG: tRNA uridine-5-carboxymethylaminomethyl(34) synthesis GTPase MnmE [bacterium]
MKPDPLNHSTDIIAAIATPTGRGGIGIVRLSGKNVAAIAQQILGTIPKPRYAHYGAFYNHQDNEPELLDYGIALYFPAPHSFTGEDVLELHGHGGAVILDRLLQHCVTLGARLAEPGEFSQRAFLNNKLDLAQAEAIADLIDSSSLQAAKSALRTLHGTFSQSIDDLRQQLLELRIYTEAALDFPDEEIDFLADQHVLSRLLAIQQQVQESLQQAEQGRILREGMTLVIAGRPNAGKSSLLNALAGTDSAIVTDIAGTTRDIIRENIHLDGMPLHIIDTAGLRESNDPVEQIGIEKAQQVMQQADLILILLDHSDSSNTHETTLAEIRTQLPEQIEQLIVYNKIDLSQQIAQHNEQGIFLSAKQALGLDLLKTALKEKMGYQNHSEGTFLARRRHIDALQRSQAALARAHTQLTVFHAGELMAEELRIAQDTLGEITGKMTSDDLLGEIFSSFCIGK